jgi:hypothetical protein
MTAALEGGECSAARPDRNLLPEKNRYPLYRRLVEPQGRSGQVRKISPPPGFDPRTVQSLVSRYTDWATRPTVKYVRTFIYIQLVTFSFLSLGSDTRSLRCDRYPRWQKRKVSPKLSWLNLCFKTRVSRKSLNYPLERDVSWKGLTFKRRIKSRLPFDGIIRRLRYSTRFQDKG